MLPKLILQYILITDHYVVHLKVIQRYIPILPQYKHKNVLLSMKYLR